MKRKVLFVVDERIMGGVSVVLKDMIHFMDKSIYEIDLLCLHDRGEMLNDLVGVNLFFGTSYFEAIDYTLKEIIAMRNFNLLLKKIRVIFDLKTGYIKKRIVKERKKIINKEYDVEIAYKDGFTALFTAYGNTKKKVHWLHCAYATNNPNAKYETLFKDALPRFDAIAGVATNVVKEFNEIYHLEHKTEVIPLAMDSERILKKANELHKVQLKSEHINIAVVGRAHPVKGYERMINVVSKLVKENIFGNVKIHIFGDGPLFDTCCQLIKEKGLQETIIMEGSTDNPYAEMKEFDFLLLPSYSEAFGTVISEAFICELPVLATRTSASEMSVKDEYGWICENDDEGIYSALKNIVLNVDEIQKRKDNLKEYRYNNEIIIEKINKILSD